MNDGVNDETLGRQAHERDEVGDTVDGYLRWLLLRDCIRWHIVVSLSTDTSRRD